MGGVNGSLKLSCLVVTLVMSNYSNLFIIFLNILKAFEMLEENYFFPNIIGSKRNWLNRAIYHILLSVSLFYLKSYLILVLPDEHIIICGLQYFSAFFPVLWLLCMWRLNGLIMTSWRCYRNTGQRLGGFFVKF